MLAQIEVGDLNDVSDRTFKAGNTHRVMQSLFVALLTDMSHLHSTIWDTFMIHSLTAMHTHCVLHYLFASVKLLRISYSNFLISQIITYQRHFTR